MNNNEMMPVEQQRKDGSIKPGRREYVVGKGYKDEALPEVQAIGKEQIEKAVEILQKYKDGKVHLENKIIQNEQWWKLRHWESVRDPKNKYTPATAWLWNTIVSKHADMMDGYPEPNILPREAGDEQEAKMLSDIVPVVLEQNDFHNTYSDVCQYKLKHGAGIYGVFWDSQKFNGMGDIAIKKIDAINLFWQPGISNIQDSTHLFHTELIDNDVLMSKYPELKDKHLKDDRFVAKYLYDDTVDTSDKSTVIDWYYHKETSKGKKILHYVKFVGDTVLFATENETVPPTVPVIDPATQQQAVNPETGDKISQQVGKAMAETGLYDHGLYPFVFDDFYKIEGSPFGYGYTDVLKDTQISIDQLNSAIVKNSLMAAKKRFFVADGTDVNLEDFTDWEKDLVPVASNMSDETIREISVNNLSGTYVEILRDQINTLKETAGNRDVNNGSSQSGITAASALAVLAEAGNKTSRDLLSNTYEAYKRIILQVIELIRQFYDIPRQFRIIGERGAMQYVTYSNAGIKAQDQGTDFGFDMGFRVPIFDIEVGAEKASPYNKMSHNELALQFYQLGFFNPSNATQALAVMDMMDFDGKEDLMAKLQQNGTLLTMFQQLFQTAVGLAQTFQPEMVVPIMSLGAQAGIVDQGAMQAAASQQAANSKPIGMQKTDSLGNIQQDEHPLVANMRERMQNSTQPNG